MRTLSKAALLRAQKRGLASIAISYLAGQDVWFRNSNARGPWYKAIQEGYMDIADNYQYTNVDPTPKPEYMTLYMKRLGTGEITVTQREHNYEPSTVIIKTWQEEIPNDQ